MSQSKPHSGPNPYRVAFVGGVLGAAIMSVLMWFGIWRQWTALSLEMLLGSLITRTANLGTWGLGFAWHLLNGGLFALVYAVVFKKLRQSGPVTGGLVGAVHWIFAGLILNLLYAIHPLMIEGYPVTGFFFWTIFGGMTVFGSLIFHVTYGAIVGTFYSWATRRAQVRRQVVTEDREAA